MRDQDHRRVLSLALVTALLVQVGQERTAEACGCLSPPRPDPVNPEKYAVNQRAEQIIFEVEPGWVTAHVLIKYAGAPEKFAWIIPVPEIPELAISPVSAFGLIDQLTAPDVAVEVANICPTSAWQCNRHPVDRCSGGGGGCVGGINAGSSDDFSPTGDAPAADNPTGVDIIDQKVVGDYETVTFRATEAALASQWLTDNGFIVNSTTSIYMESYVQQNMVFVAAKLVAGAGIDAIKPLRLKYRSPYPMVPLVLTAVAAEPHLTVSSFVFGNMPFKPMGHPVVTIDPARLAQDRGGRTNYPMVLARAIDEAGGDGFAIEFRGAPVRPEFGQNSGFGQTACCDGGGDICGVGFNGQCECPRDEFDRADCQALGDIVEGVALVDSLAARYTTLTRITTRVSPEEMTFDPTFEPDFAGAATGRLKLRGKQASLAACSGAVVDSERPKYADADAKQDCSAMYCGINSQCVTTDAGAACACSADTVAHVFDDLDSRKSVTCIPRVPPVDLRAGGLELPDACAGVSCGAGTCLDRNGVAVCACDFTAAAVTSSTGELTCAPIRASSNGPGAQNYSADLEAISVCTPAPPACEGGWLTKGAAPERPGVNCGGVDPDPIRTIEPPRVECDDFFGCGCQGGNQPFGGVVIGGLIAALVYGGRRRPSRRAAS